MTQFLYIDHILNEYKCVVNKYFLIDFYEKYVVTPGRNYFFYSLIYSFIQKYILSIKHFPGTLSDNGNTKMNNS